MKITVDTTDVLEGVEFGIITPEYGKDPLSTKTFILIEIVQILLKSFFLSVALIPAIFYILTVGQYWTVLKAEGLTLWQAGTGLVALYGLALHWWRTSIQSKLYQIEMKKAYRSEL